MAGIGFELKKIYRKDGISRALVGALYSSLITIGPTIIIIVTILILYRVLGLTNVPVLDRELLSSTILYIFIFSVILTSPFNAVFSRYLADLFYEERFDDVLPSYYVGLALISIVGLILALPVMWSLYYRGGVDIPFIFASFMTWAALVCGLFSIIYLHATKDYRTIAFFYIFSLAIGGLASLGFWKLTSWDEIHSVIYGLAIGFALIAINEFAYIRRYFQKAGSNYTGCLAYLWNFKSIFFTNLFYILGLYVHNFVFWTTPSHLYIANTFYTHQAYDMATCLAMFSNISTMVIFTVIAETRFHDDYQKYMEAIIGGTYKMIQKNKKILFRTLSQQLGQVFGLQLSITCVCFMLIELFGQRLGYSSMTLSIYPCLTAGFLGVFMMYCNIIYLFYFEDSVGTAITGLLFFTGTLGGAVLSTRLPVELYGIGLFIGMVFGWTFSFFRLRYVERNIEALIFCRYKIIETMKSSAKGRVVYKRGG